ATFAVGATAATGGRNVMVTVGGNASGAQTVTVNSAVPTLASVAPASGTQGTNPSVTLTGTFFNTPGGISVNVGAPGGITVTGVTVNSATQATATFSIDPATAAGGRSIMVSNASGTSPTPVTFSVG